jgi:large subunit ribosomal protein L18
LAVFRSLNHIYAQLIDDRKGKTLVSASSNEKKSPVKSGGNVAGAKEVGKLVAERAKAQGISKIVFDRGGYLYHGRIKALADAARAAGLEF